MCCISDGGINIGTCPSNDLVERGMATCHLSPSFHDHKQSIEEETFLHLSVDERRKVGMSRGINLKGWVKFKIKGLPT